MDTRFTPEAAARTIDDDTESDFNFDADFEEQNTTPPSVPELNFERDPLYNFPQPGTANCSTPTSSYSSNVSASEGQELMAMMRHVPRKSCLSK